MRSELFRGDSFQCIINDPANALRAALVIKTYIRSLNTGELYSSAGKGINAQKSRSVFYNHYVIDARMAIGIGNTERTNRKIATSHGEAFTLSGHLLDSIYKTKKTLAIISNDQYKDELETEAILLDAILSKTSALQCSVLNLKLLSHTEEEIAQKLKVGQSAVNQRSTGGSWNAINAMVERFEKIYKA